MKTLAPLAVPFREVRHDQPDDCLHHESIDVRGRLHHWTIPPHRHEALHQFQLLERGSATLTLDDEVHALQAPTAFMVAPGTVHAIDFRGACAGHQITLPSARLCAALAAMPELRARLDRSAVLAAPLDAAELEDGLDLCGRLAREFQAARPGRQEALWALATLSVLWFLRRAATPTAGGHRAALRDTLVQRYRTLLEQHYREHRPLTDYAGWLQVSADHLSRACKAVAGQSALDLMHERLLLEARRLLHYTSVPVAEVARELGFEDAGYFSRFYRRRTGSSPVAWRAGLARGLVEAAEPPASSDRVD